MRTALAYAMVMASFTIQHFSVAGLRGLTWAAVEARMATLEAMVTEAAG